MADLKLILQAATKQRHASEVISLLKHPDAEQVLLSVAFVRQSGVDLLAGVLKPLEGRVAAYVGIRNDITSVQGVNRLLDVGVKVFGVDTGSRHIIFHPKLYLATNKKHADAIIGSANLTFSGLNNNIEASTRVALDLASEDDAGFVDAVLKAFGALPTDHPDHVIPIKTATEVKQLFDEGRLVDEAIVTAPAVVHKAPAGGRDKLPKMKLFHVPPPPTTPTISGTPVVPAAAPAPTTPVVPTAAAQTATPAPTPAAPAATPAPSSAPAASPTPAPAVASSSGPVLVWKSKGLTERDLNIPKGLNTNPTGSMGMKVGAYTGIDHRHYFRDVVFDGLAWHPDGPSHEVATADFELIVKHLSYGVFNLLISHNTSTTSKSYRQGNMMTHVHWGDAKPIVAKDDLLDRTMYLYRRGSTPPTYVIEID
jgi:HKD family nuclease